MHFTSLYLGLQSSIQQKQAFQSIDSHGLILSMFAMVPAMILAFCDMSVFIIIFLSATCHVVFGSLEMGRQTACGLKPPFFRDPKLDQTLNSDVSSRIGCGIAINIWTAQGGGGSFQP